LGPDHTVTRVLAAGVAVHHGQIPEVVREAIKADFRDRRFPVIVATNTLAQGVNLPVRTVIVHSCGRYSTESGVMERIPARDYWNIAGRAGRAKEETEGTIIHIVLSPTDRRDYEFYRSARDNPAPIDSIRTSWRL
jgi:replicative superfamily II helicase